MQGAGGLPGPGEIVAGKYRIEQVVGQGGMGIVVRAVHVHLQERVAMKLLHPDAALHTDAITRFVREARASARIKSEHVVRVTDVGTMENGAPYLVMEFLDGQDLSSLVASRGPLPVHEAVDYVLQACEGIAEAHAMGIVHRDLKPANLFLARRSDGRAAVKVLDFGISKVTEPGSDVSLTATSAVMGSPLYMSPEQIRSSKSVDHRSDVWALGVILYELLSGRAPFGGETVPEVSVKIAVEPPPSLRSLRGDLPPALEAIVLRCLEKDRERRFTSVAELATALLPYAPRSALVHAERAAAVLRAAGLATGSAAPDSGYGAPPASIPQSAATPAPAATNTAFGRTSARSSRGWTVLVLGGVVVAVAAAVAFKLFVAPVPADRTAPEVAAAPPIVPSPPPAITVEPTTAPRVEPLPATPSVSTASGSAEPSATPASPSRPARPQRPSAKPATKIEAPTPAPAPKPEPAKKPDHPERGLFDDRKL